MTVDKLVYSFEAPAGGVPLGGRVVMHPFPKSKGLGWPGRIVGLKIDVDVPAERDYAIEIWPGTVGHTLPIVRRTFSEGAHAAVFDIVDGGQNVIPEGCIPDVVLRIASSEGPYSGSSFNRVLIRVELELLDSASGVDSDVIVSGWDEDPFSMERVGP